jgi:hypothetical protein
MSNNQIPIVFNFEGRKYEGYILPMQIDKRRHQPRLFHIMLNTIDFGYIKYLDKQWLLDNSRPQTLANLIGDHILAWSELEREPLR